VLVGPVWTLCIEVGFYALLPFLALAMMRTAARTSRHRPAAVVLASLAALAGFGLLYNQFMGWGYGLPTTVLGFLPQFAAGMALAVAVELRVFRSAGRQLLIAAAVVAAVALAIQNLGPANNTEGSGPLFGAAIAIAFALALAAVVLPERPLLLSRALSSRPLVWLGTISYGIYLWHYPVILWLGDHESTSTVAGLGLTIALTVALAVLSWRAVESPAMQLQRRGLLSRRGAVAPEGPAAPARRTPAPEATR
jgi:peptidoglycan/LPS O-acetylase OafA/YrhL